MSSFSISLSGIEAAQGRFDAAAQRIANQGPSPQDSVELISSRNDNASNANAIHIADEMTKSAIDLVG